MKLSEVKFNDVIDGKTRVRNYLGIYGIVVKKIPDPMGEDGYKDVYIIDWDNGISSLVWRIWCKEIDVL